MKHLIQRITNYVQTVNTLIKAKVTPSSIFLFPIRRRLRGGYNRLDLKNGISIISSPDEPLLHMFREIWVNHCYAPDDLNIAPGTAIIDIGANVGVFALWAAVRNPEVRVLCVEPSARMCVLLAKNVSMNEIHNIDILQCACGRKQEEAVLYARGPEVMNTLYCHDNYGSQFHQLARVQVRTLDDVFQHFQVSRCSLLKLDCEGAEYDILFNTPEDTLNNIERISLEYHLGLNGHGPRELADFLNARGFDVEVQLPHDEESGYLYSRRRM